MSSKIIRILLKSYDYALLDSAVNDVCNEVKKTGASISGPIPVPTKKRYFSVIRSPHIYNTSRETFCMFTHKRVIELKTFSNSTLNALMNLSIPSSVSVGVQEVDGNKKSSNVHTSSVEEIEKKGDSLKNTKK